MYGETALCSDVGMCARLWLALVHTILLQELVGVAAADVQFVMVVKKE